MKVLAFVLSLVLVTPALAGGPKTFSGGTRGNVVQPPRKSTSTAPYRETTIYATGANRGQAMGNAALQANDVARGKGYYTTRSYCSGNACRITIRHQ
jgi:hypothetical protein